MEDRSSGKKSWRRGKSEENFCRIWVGQISFRMSLSFSSFSRLMLFKTSTNTSRYSQHNNPSFCDSFFVRNYVILQTFVILLPSLNTLYARRSSLRDKREYIPCVEFDKVQRFLGLFYFCIFIKRQSRTVLSSVLLFLCVSYGLWPALSPRR